MTFTLWFTGLPGSGKTTVATQLCRILRDKGFRVEQLDSDPIGEHLRDVLGCDAGDRDLLARTIGVVCAYLNRNGVVCLACATTPRARIRQRNRDLIGNYHEIFCNCPPAEAEKRDPKGLYGMARAGMIENFTGVDEAYEIPKTPELVLNTDAETDKESVARILAYLDGAYLLAPGREKGQTVAEQTRTLGD
jgi:adenylyl-sulfate kinase